MNARTALIPLLVAAALAVGCNRGEDNAVGDAPYCLGDDCDGLDPNFPGFDDVIDGDDDSPNICKGDACTCELGPDGGFCLTDYCGVVMEPGLLTQKETVRVATVRSPGLYRDELLGERACSVGTLESKPTSPFEVLVRYDQEDIPVGFEEEETLGVHLEPSHTLAMDTALDIDRNRVSFSAVRGGVTVGATVLPMDERVADVYGLPDFEIDDPTTYIQSLSNYRFEAVAHDGQRFYAGNGYRLLIWNDGVPEDPTTPPDVILGRPNLEPAFMLPSPSAFSGSVSSIWTNGEKLAVAEGNRILIWSGIPDTTFAPADIVIGQEDFTSQSPNRGLATPSAASLSGPQGIWSDGRRFVVADTMNHRYLIWNSFPSINGQPADLVLGQEDFDENQINGGELPAYQAWGVYSDGEKLALASRFSCECFHVFNSWPTESNANADYVVGHPGAANRIDPTTFAMGNALSGFGDNGIAFRNGSRVSIWTQWPTQTRPADITLGKPDDTIGGVLGDVSASSFASSEPFGDIFSTDDQFFVGDGRRLLVWKGLPENDFEEADMVIGQPSFGLVENTVDYRGIGPDTLAEATAISSAGNVTVVADRANNRVLVIRGTDPFVSDDITVLGQADLQSYFPNRFQTATASTLASPTGVFTDGTRVIVADAGNHRVLIWNSVPESHGAPADLVLGQSSFLAQAQNRGMGDADADGDFDASASTLHYPSGVHFDGKLYVADTYNHRVLVWNTLPTANGEAADGMIGQDDMAANEPNRGKGWYNRDANTLARPVDVTSLGDGRIAVSDSENSRVLVFDAVGPQASAIAVLGQPSFTANVSPNYYGGVNIGLSLPENVKDAAANTLRNPWGLAWTGETLLVADRSNNRALEFDNISTGASAFRVYGQPDFNRRASNEESVTPETLDFPQGVGVMDSGARLISDTENNRVLRFTTGTVANAVFGQDLFHENRLNGASPALDSLNRPGGIALEPDGVHLWVADRANHRVIRFNGRNEELVLGQRNPGGSTANGGLGRPAAWTFDEPADVWTDGEKLIVADEGNNRVLIWTSLPKEPTTPADAVIGQTTFASARVNGGAGQFAGRNTLFGPQGVYVDDQGALWIADTGNNRVLVYDDITSQTGASASRVACQFDFHENRPNNGTGTASATGCSGPTDMIVVDKNVWIADSRNNRVLRFPVTTNGDEATLVLGQQDFTGRRPAGGEAYPSAVTLADPTRIAYDGRTFWIVDRGHNRVLKFDRIPTETYTPADQVLGQESMDTAVSSANTEGLDSPHGLAILPGDYNEATVFVSDAGRHRVILFDHVSRPF